MHVQLKRMFSYMYNETDKKYTSTTSKTIFNKRQWQRVTSFFFLLPFAVQHELGIKASICEAVCVWFNTVILFS